MVNMLKVLIAVVILIAIIGVAILGKKLARILIFKSAKTPQSESLWIEIISGTLVIGLSLAYYMQKRPEATAMMWIGTLIFFLGWILQLIARKHLHEDRTFQERLSTGFEAAQTGIYGRLRYPSKSALLLILTGFTLAMGSWWGLTLLIVLFFPSLLFRISQEEKTFQDEFGERWLSYKSDTRKIIPGVL